MKLINGENIYFEGSYILGWSQQEEDLALHMEFLLTDKHRAFEPFDEVHEVGCFKRGKLVLRKVLSSEGLSSAEVEPVYNEKLGEFKDVYEVYGIQIGADCVEIETDENVIKVYGLEAEVQI